MLTPKRAITLYQDSGRELPRVEALEPLYRLGARPRHGDVMMIAGRSGTQKSGLALFYVASMNLPTLYFAADMSGNTVSTRLASMSTGFKTEQVEEALDRPLSRERQIILDALEQSNVQIVTGELSWRRVEQELEAYTEIWDAYPQVVVFDNLMDFEGAEADYTAQMAVMSGSAGFAQETEATTILLHHASDKSWDARAAPFEPPSRDQVKGGLSEKPHQAWGVAFDPNAIGFRSPQGNPLYRYRIALIKQRTGWSDPTARNYAELLCEPDVTRFHAR